MRFSMILEMVDRLSGPARRARAGARGLGDNVRQMGQRIRRAVSDVRSGERSLEHFARRARRLRQVALGRIFQAIGSSVRGLTRNLGSLIARLRLVERAGRAAGAGLRKLGGMAGGALKNSFFGLGTAAVGGGSFALFDLFRTAGQFEQYQASLEGTEGSVQAAKSAMAWVQKFTAETPYELSEVMEAFVRLRQFGLDPMDGSLATLGDASAAIGAPMMQAVEMMTDATQGNLERLQEFGIKARKEGNRTVLSYVKDGKDIQRTVTGTGTAIKEALIQIFNERFGGGMIRQSKTLFGIVANLKDKWSEFLLLIANAGIFDFVKKRLQGLLDKVNEMAANGELQAWAQTISDRMIKAWEWGEKFIENDWDRVKQDFRDIADAVKVAADAILALKGAADWLDSWTPDLFSAERSIFEGIKGLRGSLAPSSPGPAPGSPASRLPSDNDFIRRLQGKPAAAPQIGGALKIDISSAPGLSVRATPAPAPGRVFPLEVRTGRTMRSGS